MHGLTTFRPGRFTYKETMTAMAQTQGEQSERESSDLNVIAHAVAIQAEQAAQRPRARQRPDPNAMNVISLGAWLRLTEQLGIPSIPAIQITSLAISDIWPIFDGQPPVSAEGQAAFAALRDGGAQDTIVRWDCCAGYEVKHRLGTGHPEWHPDFARPLIDDPRFADILYDYGERYGATSLPVWRRPWMARSLDSAVITFKDPSRSPVSLCVRASESWRTANVSSAMSSPFRQTGWFAPMERSPSWKEDRLIMKGHILAVFRPGRFMAWRCRHFLGLSAHNHR
jgi:hypothetical protein